MTLNSTDKLLFFPTLSQTESQNLPRQPPLEVAISHARQCLHLMSRAHVGACAFADIDSYLS